MWLKYCLFLCTALTATAVKVDLLGSLTLGSEVADFLSSYLKEDVANTVNGRRTMTDALHELLNIAKHMQPCKNLKICTNDIEQLLIDYVSALISSIKPVFSVFDDELCKVRYFQKSLKHFKKVVANATADADEVYRWINVFKRISGNFLEQSIQLTSVGLDKVAKKEEAANALRRELVIKITDVENEYLAKICKEFTFCPYQYEATIYLQLLLNIIKNMKETNVKLFLSLFQRVFLRSPVFTEDAEVMKKFDDILKEMVLQTSVTAKDIVLSISDIVQKRLSTAESTEKDAVLLQMILADTDHLYVNNNDEPIETFLETVKDWVKSNDRDALGNGMDAFYNGLASHFSNQPAEVVFKLKTEVQVFLDITLDPTLTK